MYAIVFNSGNSRTAIRNAMAQMSDMTPVFRDIGEYMVEATRQRFVEGVGPDGVPWAPKSEATLERYRKLGYGSLTRPLIGPGLALSRQIQYFAGRSSATIGSSLLYSGVMQEGAARGAFGIDSRGRPIPWGNIPARVWLGVSTNDQGAIVAIVDEHLKSVSGFES